MEPNVCVRVCVCVWKSLRVEPHACVASGEVEALGIPSKCGLGMESWENEEHEVAHNWLYTFKMLLGLHPAPESKSPPYLSKSTLDRETLKVQQKRRWRSQQP